MNTLDWFVVAAYCAVMVGVGVRFARRAGRSPEDYFVGGRSMPWWLIGLSDVSSYGAASAPWVMLFFLGGFRELWLIAWVTWCVWMPLVAVVWSRMWRRLGVVTTAEFIECRYSGKAASAYRAVYAGYAYLAWAVLLLANIAVWFTQSISPILGWSPAKVLLIFGGVTIAYTLMAGFFGVVYTELIQFFLIMAGALAFMWVAVGAAGGLHQMYARVEAARGAALMNPWPGEPLTGPVTLVALFVQGLFFAGSPFAGEGWTAQRAMSARSENHAVLGQMLNCVLSLVVRVVPAVFIGMAVVALYPRGRVDVPGAVWAMSVRDLAPHGLLGLLFAGALGAFMAGISSVVNWGSSYLLNDIYRRHVRTQATAREYLLASRVITAATLAAAYLLAMAIDPRQLEAWVLFMNSAVIVFSLPLAWLKWFWWRMNVWGEAVGTLGSFPLAWAVWFAWGFGDTSRYPFWYGFAILFVSGWVAILAVTLLTPPEPDEVLRRFYLTVRPMGFWGPVARHADEKVRRAIRRASRRDLEACAWGVLFCFAMVAGFFNLCARAFAVGTAACAAAAVCGWQFRRTAVSRETQL
jgi:SSS family solute:Na+ symporter